MARPTYLVHNSPLSHASRCGPSVPRRATRPQVSSLSALRRRCWYERTVGQRIPAAPGSLSFLHISLSYCRTVCRGTVALRRLDRIYSLLDGRSCFPQFRVNERHVKRKCLSDGTAVTHLRCSNDPSASRHLKMEILQQQSRQAAAINFCRTILLQRLWLFLGRLINRLTCTEAESRTLS
jgi:hypothetical protein